MSPLHMERQKGDTLRDLQQSVWLTRDDRQLKVMFDHGAQIIKSAMVARSASTGSQRVSKHLFCERANQVSQQVGSSLREKVVELAAWLLRVHYHVQSVPDTADGDKATKQVIIIHLVSCTAGTSFHSLKPPLTFSRSLHDPDNTF